MRIQLLKPRPSLFSVFFVLLFSAFGYAQDADVAKYPTRPITFIVAYSPGGTGDLAIRLMAKEAEKFLGQPIVVTNKTGGGGTVGGAAVATAKPDGYTIGQSPSGGALVVIPFTEKIPFNPINDFRYIMQPVEFDMGVIVKAESPFKTFKDLLAFARAIKEPAFEKGMKDLRVNVLYRNSKELTDYVTANYEFFGKLLKEIGIAK